MKSKVMMVLGVSNEEVTYARKTSVKVCNYKDVSKFMQANHIQGTATGAVYLGCFLEDTIVGCMVMKGGKDGIWELSRFCTKGRLVGGFTKILSFFKKNFEWSEIFSFADFGISDGGVYEKAGFSFDHHTDPIMHYVKGKERFRRQRFMKHKLPKIFDNVDMSKTEKEIMEENGYLQLYDAGLLRYTLKK